MSGQSRLSCGLISHVGGGSGGEVWLGKTNISVRGKEKPEDGLVMFDAEERPTRDDGEPGEDSFFVLSSKTRSWTTSGSLNVITLASRFRLATSVDDLFESLTAAVTGVCSSSWVALYSSNRARLLGVTMTL